MLKPTFKIESQELIYVTKDYFCNGHWLVKRELPQVRLFKPLAKLYQLQHGRYESIKEERISEETPKMDQVIPKRDNYLAMGAAPLAAHFVGDNISAYKYLVKSENGEFEIGVNVKYVPLLSLGHAFAKDRASPIIVLDDANLNGNLVAVIMPMRV